MTRRVTNAVLTLFLVALPALATDTPDAAAMVEGPQPKAVAVEAIQDLGVLPKGETAEVDFQIRNDGDAALIIHEARPACGCTVADFDATIAPGKIGKVHAELDSTNLHGPNRKTITVYTNDPENPSLTLTIQSDVRPFLSVVPGYARFNFVRLETEGNVTQTLWAEDGNDFEIVGAKSPFPYLHVAYREAAETERNADGKGRQWKVDIKLDADAPVGALTDYVTITTNHPKQKFVKLPVSGFVRPVIAVTPAVADFRQLKLGEEEITTQMIVKTYATEPISLLGAESTVEYIKPEIIPVEEGRHYNLKLHISPQLPKGAFAGKIRIKTDSKKMPMVEVDLKGTVV